MKYFYDLKNSEILTEAEHHDLRINMTKGGVSIPMFFDVDFYWNKMMGKEVNGCFSIFYPHKVFVTLSFRGDLIRLASVAAHELKHRADFLVNPMLYIICCAPLLRLITIEPRALRIQESVNRKLEIEEGWWL